jgi:dienelactone hydrolase
VWAENLASHGYIVVAVDHPYDSAAVVLEDGTVIRSSLATTGDDETDQRIANELASIRADDLLSTLDYFETILPSATVATAGHSIGGAAAILAAARDPRVDAVVDIDGLPRGGLPTVPVLAIVAGEGTGSAESDERYDSALDEVLAFCGKRVDVRGAQHLSFTDAALL